MDQKTCLALPHHFTHLGVCYPGENAYIGITNPQNPGPVTFTVASAPEPSTFVLMLLAAGIFIVMRGFRPRASTGSTAR